ncbi:GNAT family N-acetyltransferase [Roseateles sp. BYS180W]|uniref:GNAT family N-acetyltransferase n=1 Tax=Roseateles rivi TaxID=3299028 RepID=A0ABW7FXX5_9BURK
MVQYKVITPADVPVVLALQARCYGPQFLENAQAFEAKLQAAAGLHCSFLALDEREPARALGYIISLPVQGHQLPELNAQALPAAARPCTLYLHDLAVSPEGRSQRVGAALLQQVIGRARDMGLQHMALVAVQGSTAYWERHGFEAVNDALPSGVRRHLSSFGPQACYMRRALRPH